MGGVATGPRSHSPSMPMADHFTQDALAFTCLIGEAALIDGARQLAADLMGDFTPESIIYALLAVFLR